MNAIEQKLKERRDKADGQLRLALNALFTPLIQVANKQNQGSHHNWTRDIFVTAAVKAIVKLADQYYRRRTGEDVEIMVDAWKVNGTMPMKEKQ